MSLLTESLEPAPTKVDPRIGRTRLHVLTVAREMLTERKEALTFSLVADRALVSRRTLYTHWGTIENLISDTVVLTRIGDQSEYIGRSIRERAVIFLTRAYDRFDVGTAAALIAVIAAAPYGNESTQAYARLYTGAFGMFKDSVGHATEDEFIQIFAPVIYMAISGGRVSHELIDSLAERAETLLGDRIAS